MRLLHRKYLLQFSLILFAGMTSKVDGQILLGAPDVSLTSRSEDRLPFTNSANLGRYYKFVYTGAEVQADADGVPGSFSYDGYMWAKKKKNNNGHGNNIDGVDSSNPGKSKQGEDSDPSVDDEIKGDGSDGSSSGSGSTTSSTDKVFGWWKFLTKVNNHEISGMEFSTAKLHQLSDVIRVYFSTPVVFREENIQLTWSGDGNSHDPDGHLYILGSAIKEPPVPWGHLNLGQTLYTEGAKPVYQWNITRE